MMKVAIIAAAGLVEALHYTEVTSAHFATHEAVLHAPSVDLTGFGYAHQLPRAYSLINTTYEPEHSYQIFKDIISGNHNATAKPHGLAVREENHELHFQLEGTNGGENCVDMYNSNNIDPSKCYSGNGCASWYRAIVYTATNAYVTLWEGMRCTNTHKSFNPPCPETKTRDCDMQDFKPSSYGTKLGCHQQYSSGACTGGLTTAN